MEQFIDSQIKTYNNKKYNISNYEKILYKYPSLSYFEIINNIITRVIYPKSSKNDKLYNARTDNIVDILTLLLKKYSIKDTYFYMHVEDGYFWKVDLDLNSIFTEDVIPVFNWAIPFGKQGLIFPNFDILDHNKIKKNNFDEIKNKCIKYKPNKRIKRLFFIGKATANFRVKLSKYPKPFKVIITDKQIKIYKFKKFKYLLDLPGYKPWSIRLKYLFCMSRVVIRLSFYRSKFGETGYWKQWFDYIFEENVDYIHLVYDNAKCYGNNKFYNPDDKIMKQITDDVLNVYNNFENNPQKYKDMVKNLKKKRESLNISNTLKYLHMLISKYTDELLVK